MMSRRAVYELAAALVHEVQQQLGEVSPSRRRAVAQRLVLDSVVRAMRSMREMEPVASEPNVACDVLAGQLGRPEVRALLASDDALGRVYQALNAPLLESAYRATAASHRRKFKPREIPAVTQLFTPRWVVEYLLHNTLGRLWLQIHPDTTLRSHLSWLVVAADLDVPPEPLRRIIDIHVLDPACGTMNFGLVAAELLQRMYREELDRAGQAGWPDEPSVRSEPEIAPAILRHNLAGVDIDPVALELARESLAMKLRVPVFEIGNLWRGNALLNPRIGRRCRRAFDVVVTNPPYLSTRNLSAPRVRPLKRRYGALARDCYACFIDRCLQFTRPGGRVGILSMQSFMFTSAFESLRDTIRSTAAMETIAHFGPSLFDLGNAGTLQTVGFTAQRDDAPDPTRRLVAFRLVEPADEPGKRAALAEAIAGSKGRYSISHADLSSGPRGAWAYWTSPAHRQLFDRLPALSEIAPPRQGLATTDNARFVRYWWEVAAPPWAPMQPTPGKWFPYAKGGGHCRWFGRPRHVVNWLDDGREIKQSICQRYPYLDGQWKWVAKNAAWYGREGVTYSYLTSGRFSARLLPAGAIFDVAGSSIFPDDPLMLLAVLNSTVARDLLDRINPTVNFQVGDLGRLPVPRRGTDELRDWVGQAIDLRRRIDGFDEREPGFDSPMPWRDAEEWHRALYEELADVESRIDAAVAELYGVGHASPRCRAVEPFDQRDLARRWVSYALGHYLGRWQSAAPDHEPAVPLDPVPDAVIASLTEILLQRMSSGDVEEIDRAVGGIASFLRGSFVAWHTTLHRRRPIYWCLRGRRTCWLVAHWSATAEQLGAIGVRVPHGWRRWPDDGIAANLSALTGVIADKAQQGATRAASRKHRRRWREWAETFRRARRVPSPLAGEG